MTSDEIAGALLAQCFDAGGDELGIDGVGVRALAQRYGTPLYVYSARQLRRNFRELSAALDGFAQIHYSIKANPNPQVVRSFVAQGAGLEIASGGELRVALQTGCDASRIVFAGPAKSDAELALAIDGGIGEIHLESMHEIAALERQAAAAERRVPVAIRVNPSPAASGGAMRMGGKAAPFGFDEEALDEPIAALRASRWLQLRGVHLFAGTQILDARVLLAQWAHAIDVAARVARAIAQRLATIDVGGGLGVPYHAGERPLDLQALREGLGPLAAAIRAEPLLRDARVIVEPGRFLAANAGVYLMRVVAIKHSRGTRFVICDGGMHHHLAASGNLGQVVKRDYPIVAATRLHAAEREPAMLTGPLCTPLDTLGRQCRLPALEPGDLVAVLQSGAYGLTASPIGFLSHPTPAEVLVDAGAHRAIRERGGFDEPRLAQYGAAG